MYELVALAAILIGILLFSKTRERLEPTPKIKSAGEYENPNLTEVDYRWSVTPQAVKDQLLKFVNSATLPMYESVKTPEEKAKRFGSSLIEQFYGRVYQSATTEITEKNVDDYITEFLKEVNPNQPQKDLTPDIRNAYKTLIESGALKQLLVAYFISPTATPAEPAEPAPEMPTIPVENMPPEFAQALEVYRMNYVEYRATGKTAYKTAYETAQQWIDTYMENLRKKLQQDAEYVGKFTQEYAAMNPELSDLQSKMKKIQVQGPELQDTYTTVKNLDQTVPPDTSSYYVKGAVAAAVVGIIVVFSFF